MGWYVSCSLCFVSKQNKKLVKHFIFACLTLLITVFPIFSQTHPKAGNESKNGKYTADEIFKVKISFPALIYHKYVFTDSTKVLRTYSDGSTKTYNRVLQYSYTFFAPNPPSEGFQKVKIDIDSLIYSFKGDSLYIFYDSQNGHAPNTRFPDWIANMPMLSKTFDLTYSPYYEVANIEDEKLQELRNYINDKGGSSMDSLTKYMWIRGYSHEHLLHFTEMNKGIIPFGSFQGDSVWNAPKFSIEINGMDFNDTAKVNMKSYNAGIITLEAKCTNIQPQAKEIRSHGISKLTQVESGTGTGNYEFEVNTQGLIKRAEGIFDTEVNIRIGNEVFKEKIKSHQKWTLIGGYRM
ncbi:MAG: hypothetical protein NT007_08745 [Candidatus Kapabacteria bacterium]|nr:hypothetical protein [Candidatus Kapabacteria bacterium]